MRSLLVSFEAPGIKIVVLASRMMITRKTDLCVSSLWMVQSYVFLELWRKVIAPYASRFVALERLDYGLVFSYNLDYSRKVCLPRGIDEGLLSYLCCAMALCLLSCRLESKSLEHLGSLYLKGLPIALCSAMRTICQDMDAQSCTLLTKWKWRGSPVRF